MICSVCETADFKTSQWCVNCGSAMISNCPTCGTKIQPGFRFCPGCGNSLVAPPADTTAAIPKAGMMPGAERRQVSILFGDFSEFTSYSSRLDPEDLRDTLRDIWANLDAIITTHGGTPEKHSGDAIMAVFGGWKSREEDPAQAVRAALAMQTWLKGRIPENGPRPLQMRIAVHTGVVVVGPADHSGEFLATGDAVNLASRLQQCAPVGGVLISRETYDQVYGLFVVKAQPPLEIKGKTEPVDSFVVTHAKSRGVALQIRGIEGVETPMIGRKPELNRLQSVIEDAIRFQDTRVVTVIGEGGLGKSRLLREFQKWTDLQPEYFRYFCGRATLETASRPFSLISDLFGVRFEIQESDPAVVAREKFESGFNGLLGIKPAGRASAEHDHTPDIHFLGQLLGLDYTASPHVRPILGNAEQIRNQAFQSLIRLVAAMSHSPPEDNFPGVSAIRFVVEDLHWTDEGSLDLIEHLARNCKDTPLMILCSTRPAFFERRPDWCEKLSNAEQLNLDPLSATESVAMLAAILDKANQLPASLQEMVTEGAEGNPFYIEEMIKMLMDQQVLTPQGNTWTIAPGRLLSTRVPTTLTGVLQARLDSLTSAERLVIQRASVVGRNFWDIALCQMSGAQPRSLSAPAPASEKALGRRELDTALDGLRRKGLVYRSEVSSFAGSVEYVFKHELLRNVAYESLLKKARRQHHAQVAHWLKSQGSGRLHEFAGQVAAHFEQAALPAEAAEWHGRAGQQARLGYAPAIASEHFKKALALLPSDLAPAPDRQRLRLDWQEGLAETLGAQARFSEAMESCVAMRQLARSLADGAAEVRAWNNIAFLHERLGDNRASIECAERAEALASPDTGDGRGERVRALHLKGWAYYRIGDAPAVLALADQTLAICTREENRRGIATSYKLLGVGHLQLGHYPEADEYFERGERLFRELGDARNAAAMLSNRGECARARGDCRTAVEFYDRALTIARQIGSRESELIYLGNVSAARLGLEEFARAEADLRNVIAQTLTPNTCVLSEVYSFLGEACLGQGKRVEAIGAANKALELARGSESSLALGTAWRMLGRIGAGSPAVPAGAGGDTAFIERNNLNPALCFDESVRVFKQINSQGEQARSLRDWGIYEIKRGKAADGINKLRAALAIFQEQEAAFEVAATEKLLPMDAGALRGGE